jgi:uncharacterized surface protein with fasciclin (FAS1) repeats
MVSCGPDVQSLYYTHMYTFTDYRSDTKPEVCITKGSLYDIINTNPSFSLFKKVIERAGMIGQLNNINADFTLLVPLDSSLKHIPKEYFENMDSGLAKQILGASSLRRTISSELLKSSPVSYFYTVNPNMRAYVTNINGITTINNCATVIKYDIPANNGMIHIVSNIIAPNDDHFMN